ncbi:MAG: UTP--glucose-1-phosphate uridylyltransferase [Acidobacteria bacterium]|nr:UTP--glucose-1-phosphate uridylyltransferase [Acidobacteriota bacterium]
MQVSVRKAVIPAAGLGTRFLPATKSIPKEMLPLVDKPIIQYGVEEIVDSGIPEVVIITGRGKSPMEDHFDRSFELEHVLRTRQKHELLAIAQHPSQLAQVSYTRQQEARGLGHAVLCAKPLVGDEPFAVLLPDDVIQAATPCIRQLLDIHDQYQASVIALMEVPKDRISAYGVVAAEDLGNGLYRITDLVEKPKMEDAPSNLAIIGRYVFTPAGTRYDAGDKLGFLQANVAFALQRPEFAGPLKEFLRTQDWGA